MGNIVDNLTLEGAHERHVCEDTNGENWTRKICWPLPLSYGLRRYIGSNSELGG